MRSFNFHHRVVETKVFTYKIVTILSFNFHHRVVETFDLVLLFSIYKNFNFHHRVVETSKKRKGKCRNNTLTFTIGWLKLSAEELIHSIVRTLTFTIGWLKRFATRVNTCEVAFNFHHRVVETCHLRHRRF